VERIREKEPTVTFSLKTLIDGKTMKNVTSERMQKLIDALESLDDVQEVYTSAVMDE